MRFGFMRAVTEAVSTWVYGRGGVVGYKQAFFERDGDALPVVSSAAIESSGVSLDIFTLVERNWCWFGLRSVGDVGGSRRFKSRKIDIDLPPCRWLPPTICKFLAPLSYLRVNNSSQLMGKHQGSFMAVPSRVAWRAELLKLVLLPQIIGSPYTHECSSRWLQYILGSVSNHAQVERCERTHITLG